MAEAGDPDFFVAGSGAKHRVGQPGLLEQPNLPLVELFAAKVRRIDRVRIDQDHADAGASEHRGGKGACKPAPDDGDVRTTHTQTPYRAIIIAAKRLNEF